MTYEDFHQTVNNTPEVFPVFRVKEITKLLREFNDGVGIESPDMVVLVEDYVVYKQSNFETVNGEGVMLPQNYFPPGNIEFCGYVALADLHIVKDLFED